MNKDLKIKSRKEDHKETHKGTAGYSKRSKRLEKRRGKIFNPQSKSSINFSKVSNILGTKTKNIKIFFNIKKV